MIESLLEELPQHGGNAEQDAASAPGVAAVPAEHSFLASLSIVQRIVARQSLLGRFQQRSGSGARGRFQDLALAIQSSGKERKDDRRRLELFRRADCLQ